MRKEASPENQHQFLMEKLFKWAATQIERNKIPLISAFVSGFLAYMFVFTNKLLNHDEVGSLFIKGDTISSGRWGLELLSWVMPNYSMPWIYGVISIALLAVATCLICRIFSIRSKILQILLSALIVTFPSMIGTFAYMFTSSSYAVSFLMAVLAAYFMDKPPKKYMLLAFLFMILSLSIYQSYVAITASLLILILVSHLLDGQSARSMLIRGIEYVLFLVFSLVAYLILTKIIQAAMGIDMNAYAAQNFDFQLSYIPHRIRDAYFSFLDFFKEGSYGLIPTDFSRYIHIGCAIVIALELVNWAVRVRNPGQIALLAFLLVVFPLGINCMYLITTKDSIHTLVLYSFICVYILAAIVLDRNRGFALPSKVLNQCRSLALDAVLFGLATVIAVNTYVSNEAYLNMYLRYENTYSFYSSIISQVMSDPDFDSESRLAIVGSYSPPSDYNDKFQEIDKIMGVAGINPKSWSNYWFIERYMGFEISFASQAQINEITATEEYAQMSIYPYYGSIQKIGNTFVVRLE